MTVVKTSLKVTMDYGQLKVNIEATGTEAPLDAITIGAFSNLLAKKIGYGTPKFEVKEETENASEKMSKDRQERSH